MSPVLTQRLPSGPKSTRHPLWLTPPGAGDHRYHPDRGRVVGRQAPADDPVVAGRGVGLAGVEQPVGPEAGSRARPRQPRLAFDAQVGRSPPGPCARPAVRACRCAAAPAGRSSRWRVELRKAISHGTSSPAARPGTAHAEIGSRFIPAPILSGAGAPVRLACLDGGRHRGRAVRIAPSPGATRRRRSRPGPSCPPR